MAQRNLERWAAQPRESEPTFRIRVLPHDWGVATARLTRVLSRALIHRGSVGQFCDAGSVILRIGGPVGTM